jgi:pimeloyl-ACP methyl ester carboxylesterase
VPEEDADLLRGSTARLGRFAPLAERVVDFVVPRTLESTASEMVFAPVVNATIEGVGRPAAIPVVFANTLGHFLPEDVDAVKQDTAVLLLSPWGYDDMCLRKSYRILAERLAAAGIPSLRFDYPGTGDAIDGTDFSAGLKVWENAARDAVARLRELSHVSRVILIGQGIGATLAHRIAKDASDITAVAMLAPVTNGRSYLREVAFRAKFIYEDLGLKDAQRDLEGVSVAGLRMPEAIAVDVRKLNVTQVEANAAHYLIIERSVKMGDTQLLDGLLGAGAEASQREYIGYDALMTMPLTAREPIEVIEGLVEWATTMTQAAAPGIASDTVLPEQGLTGDGYVERPLRFGALNNLTGVACLPGNGPAEGTSVLLLSTAYDRHSGWGGTNVDMARQLARRGIASLRYDSANVADSPPSPDAPDRILYSDTQNRDAIAALDVLETFKPGPMMVAGRCSGAYIAFRTALQDKRLSAVIAVNPFVFYWNPAEKVPEDISIVPRSLNDYGTRFTRLETVKRLFKGEVNVRAAMRNMVVAAWRRLSFRLAPLLMYLPGRHVVAKEVKQTFSAYERANIPVTVMYSEADVGLEHLYFHFGANGRKLQRYKNVRLIFMPATDHNLTPLPAREKLFEEIVRLTGTPPAQPDQNRDEPAQKHENALDIHAA